MWDFRTFGVLPEPGGLGDQPAGLLRRMRHAERVWQVYEGFNTAGSWKHWAEKNPGAWQMKTAIDKLRQAHANPANNS